MHLGFTSAIAALASAVLSSAAAAEAADAAAPQQRGYVVVAAGLGLDQVAHVDASLEGGVRVGKDVFARGHLATGAGVAFGTSSDERGYSAVFQQLRGGLEYRWCRSKHVCHFVGADIMYARHAKDFYEDTAMDRTVASFGVVPRARAQFGGKLHLSISVEVPLYHDGEDPHIGLTTTLGVGVAL